MAQTRTFRVFVSSTFRDLEEERNYLREHVYPDLRALCANHQARFQAIDLRWGVSREASLDQQAMNVCLEEIDRCREVTPRPNLVVLLGNRHGWLAPPPQIPAEELDKLLEHVPEDEDKHLLTGPEGWYRCDDNADPLAYYLRPREGEHEKDNVWEPVEARLHAILADAAKAADYAHDPKYTASATEQEILHGALGIGALEGGAFCIAAAAARIPRVLALLGLAVVSQDHPSTLTPEGVAANIEAGIELLAECEHDGWMEQKYRDGWTHGTVRDDDAKHHPCLVQYATLSEADKEKDRNAVRHYPDVVALAGFKIVEAGSGTQTPEQRGE